ncbi:hypothetical protein BDK92_0917 [Micromonospora pisi]|uniref:Uncharacterized protein n=1 Tax=Micromonospora pisi TaxID=589240 RepID=A0A495JCM3_9ACTN|nr:hypothetical protein [Micromonospora pisi]RKR86667.1 hypothetical protein BDK92_0917 [Micromonospora pisi]
MTRKRDRLDEYVRQVTQLDDDRAATLADSTARQALFNKITRMHTYGQPESPRPSARRPIRLVAVAAGIVVVAMAVLASTGVLGWRNQPPPTASNPTQTSEQTQAPERQGDAFGAEVEASCVEQYSPQTVAARPFAFDGTVLSIAERSSARVESDPYVSVTFTVTRWFRGGHGDRVTVAMFPPDVHTSVGNASYTIGSRLLVSGADRWGNAQLSNPIAWACGFTRWYNQADAQVWREAFR